MELADFEFVLTPEGQRLLALGSELADPRDPLQLIGRLRANASSATAAQVAAIATQVNLRRRAVLKFGSQAGAMYFTHDGLEQATHPVVAEHRASRLHDASGRLLDLGCGIGSDLIAFARRAWDATGVERDPVTAAVAGANLRALGLPGVATCMAAESVDLDGFDVVFADPARRQGGSRVFDPAGYSPPWPFIEALLRPAGPGLRRAVKLAPGLDHDLIPSTAEAEWVSLDGELKETVLWAPAADVVRRRATVLTTAGDPAECTDQDQAADEPAIREVGAYLYEPDPAVVRAHLVGVVVQRTEGWLLDPHIAYVTSDRDLPTPLARRFRVVETLPFKEKALRSALRERNIGTLAIKKRGVGVTPEELRHRLALKGTMSATLVLTRTPRSARALLVEPLDGHR
jgi:SAM-dependent methyltransferase